MTAEPTPATRPSGRRRTWVVLALVVALLVVGALVVRARRQAPGAADCEKEPPKVTFAVAECDAGAALPEGAAPPAHAPAARP